MKEEDRLKEEIIKNKIALQRLRESKALPVEKVVIKSEMYSPIRWVIAIATLALSIGAIFLTEPWSRGAAHYFREAVAWIFSLFYCFFLAIPLLAPLIDSLSAFSKSPQKMKEIPTLIVFNLPSVIAFSSVIAFFYGYLGHHY